MDGRAACGARSLALQEVTATISSAARSTGPGEGPGKHSTLAVSRAGGLGTSCRLLQLVREGDRLTWQGRHCPVSNLLSHCLLHFLKPFVILILEVAQQISTQMLTVQTQLCHTEHSKVKL